MKEKSLATVGGTCSILVGISYILIGINYLRLPAVQRAGSDPTQLLPSFAQNPAPLMLQFWVFAVGSLLAFAAVLAISETVRSTSEGWVRWTSNLAILGFAVTAIDFFRALSLQPARAAAFVAGDAATKTVIASTNNLISLDPQGWLGFGGVGLWVLIVSLLVLRGRALPRNLGYVGIAVAVLYWVVVAGLVYQRETLVAIAAGAGGIIAAPVWYIWMGLELRRAAS